jgi:GMP synthase (glutamine-hydrolysing)
MSYETSTSVEVDRTRRSTSDTLGAVRILVLQHIACEPPGVFEDVLRERTAGFNRVEVDEGDALPDWREFDAIVAMGGPMSANDEAELPWLAAEKALIRDAVTAGRPFWGVCLGVQLLASALGARVYRGPAPEVGLLPVALTPAAHEDPVFAELPAELATLQWHGDTFDLPDGAVLLASSPAYTNQAFRVRRAYGVQFHLEVSAEMAREWAQVPEYVASLEQTLGPDGGPAFLAAIEARAEEMRLVGRELFERWLDAIVVPSVAAVTLSS